MQGYQLTFFTQQNRTHHGKPLAEWLIGEARQLKVGGATLLAASEGFGQAGKIHAAHFFELADQPQIVTLVVSEAEAENFLQRLQEENVQVFYTRTPVEYGVTGAG